MLINMMLLLLLLLRLSGAVTLRRRRLRAAVWQGYAKVATLGVDDVYEYRGDARMWRPGNAYAERRRTALLRRETHGTPTYGEPRLYDGWEAVLNE